MYAGTKNNVAKWTHQYYIENHACWRRGEGAVARDAGWGPWSLRKSRCCHCWRCWGRGQGLGARGLGVLEDMTLLHHNWRCVWNIEIYQIIMENQFLNEACVTSSRALGFLHRGWSCRQRRWRSDRRRLDFASPWLWRWSCWSWWSNRRWTWGCPPRPQNQGWWLSGSPGKLYAHPLPGTPLSTKYGRQFN